jgi:hypothetical protein
MKLDTAVMFNEQIQIRELLTRTICAESPLIQTFLGNLYVDTRRRAHDSKLITLSVRSDKKKEEKVTYTETTLENSETDSG